MKALIFGAGGQVGRALAMAAPAGVEVVALVRAACDVTNRDQVEQAVAAAKPGLVINAAAYTAVDRAELEPEAAALVNAAAPGWMAAAARVVGARCVHISTDFVFDGASGTPYAPGAPANPLSAYGRTKRDGEIAALAAHPGALVVRTAWVHSPHGNGFLQTMLRLMREGETVRAVADQVGTPTYAADLAEAIWSLAAAGAAGIHHVTDAGVATRYDMAVAIAEEGLAAGLFTSEPRIVPIPAAQFPAPAERPAFSVLDKSVAWALLGAPAAHWRANLRRCIAQIAAGA
jgi:dTDP-4-dehydrorhamnose reductase